MTPEQIRDRLVAERVVPVLRFASAALTERAVQCLLDVGFGVTLANMAQYRAAGAALVGVGNAIVPLDALEHGDLDAVRAHAAAYRGRNVA